LPLAAAVAVVRQTYLLDESIVCASAPLLTTRFPRNCTARNGHAWTQTPLQMGDFYARSTLMGTPATCRSVMGGDSFSAEELLVVELAAIAQDVRVGVCRDRKFALADEARDFRFT
jgi:hypothetical protein